MNYFHFICANNIESLVNNLFRVTFFNPLPSFIFYSLLSKRKIDGKFSDSSLSVDSSFFDHTL